MRNMRTRRYRSALLAATLAILSLALCGQAYAQVYLIKNVAFDEYLTTNSTTTYDNLSITDDADADSAKWEMIENGSYFYLKNVETGDYIQTGGTSQRAFYRMAPSNRTGNWTQFSKSDVGSAVRFINRRTGFYMRPNNTSDRTIEAVPTSYSGNWPRWILEEVDDDTGEPNEDWWQPTPGTTWQWQLQGTINQSYDVDMYDIDLFDTSTATINSLKDSGKAVICYFSGGSYEEWRDDASDFDASDRGNPLDDWPGEAWLDVRSSNVRAVMEARLNLAVSKGCDGVEPDNMDGYTNGPGFPLTAADQLDYNIFMAEAAHDRGLSVGLKNNVDQIPDLVEYYDFAVNEECFQYNECDTMKPFTDANKAVFNAEYGVNGANARAALCADSIALKLSTLVLDLGLDDSVRHSCL